MNPDQTSKCFQCVWASSGRRMQSEPWRCSPKRIDARINGGWPEPQARPQIRIGSVSADGRVMDGNSPSGDGDSFRRSDGNGRGKCRPSSQGGMFEGFFRLPVHSSRPLSRPDDMCMLLTSFAQNRQIACAATSYRVIACATCSFHYPNFRRSGG
jgi:hypothetical protein